MQKVETLRKWRDFSPSFSAKSTIDNGMDNQARVSTVPVKRI